MKKEFEEEYKGHHCFVAGGVKFNLEEEENIMDEANKEINERNAEEE